MPAQNPAPPTYGRVRDLRRLLSEEQLSPEQLAARTGVSNMTWRRWLSRADATALPEKYRAVLERQFGGPAPTLDAHAIAVTGLGGSEKAVLETIASDGAAVDAASVVRDAERKRERAKGLPKRLVASVAALIALLPAAPLAAKALILGALLYFINPFDLVADALLGIGFVDDMGVLAIVGRKLSRILRRKAPVPPAAP